MREPCELEEAMLLMMVDAKMVVKRARKRERKARDVEVRFRVWSLLRCETSISNAFKRSSKKWCGGIVPLERKQGRGMPD